MPHPGSCLRYSSHVADALPDGRVVVATNQAETLCDVKKTATRRPPGRHRALRHGATRVEHPAVAQPRDGRGAGPGAPISLLRRYSCCCCCLVWLILVCSSPEILRIRLAGFMSSVPDRVVHAFRLKSLETLGTHKADATSHHRLLPTAVFRFEPTGTSCRTISYGQRQWATGLEYFCP